MAKRIKRQKHQKTKDQIFGIFLFIKYQSLVKIRSNKKIKYTKHFVKIKYQTTITNTKLFDNLIYLFDLIFTKLWYLVKKNTNI